MSEFSTSTLLLAFGLTVFAGLGTGVGSLMSFFHKKFNPKFLAAALGFSAGVMIYVALIEIFMKAKDSLEGALGAKNGYWVTTAAFFAGIALIAIIDKLIPEYENPHEMQARPCDPKPALDPNDPRLMRMGFFSALAIAIHNFPEGLATFMAALSDPSLGISIAVAIAIHNIPEGVAVSAPVYFATKSRKKAFWLSLLSGMAEPVGAFIGYFLLRRWFNDITFGFVFAAVAGIMVYISLDELLPTAEEYGEHHVAITGVIAGMAVMALSLVLLS
ncbi:MAG: zinc transporter ZupT [Spirochaetia bacterium]|nr:zinc transporter ZupT [Spirochaetia bacterium]